ncbi:MAG: type II toxin-antitoxin system RelE/ParE family toxin [Sphingomonas sp.]|uniref:type II toxin-antitoxin system RelE/ParE family toxin n=1 Tax=Sphingomonas sp. TaxID=28214 RepID=UPI0017F0611D|nr:type II toxin-antitoxin system RelE/ParE family toxin [Sphingomonas sp.]MBA3667533.1 type II toxin-antitoxin system RelE/ParE family toxin [Sphingomonas sp.]
MARVVRTAAADRDLLAIADYGAERWGVDAAIDFIRGFETTFTLLEAHPDIGRERSELGEDIRSWLDRTYVLYYAYIGDEVLIGRTLHGAADPSAGLDLRNP